MITIFITGGHVTPALAVIEEVERRFPTWNIVFVGRKTSLEGEPTLSEEHKLITDKGIPFLSLTTGRLQRRFTERSIISLFKVPFGFLQALWYCISHKPDCILSFGGYVALPVACAGWILDIPVLTHEQTRIPGIANRIIANLSRAVCVVDDEVATVFGNSKVIVTGLPIRSIVFSKTTEAPFALRTKNPLLYITGGSTGALSLNQLIYPIVPKLISKFEVIHQVGRKSLEDARRVRESLSPSLRSRYIVVPYMEGSQYSWVLQHADLVVGRSGANTVAEIAALGKVALFIPLPWSGGGEQRSNAHYLARHGGAYVLDQEKITSGKLYDHIMDIIKNHSSMVKRAKVYAKTVPSNGASLVVDQIRSLLSQA